MRASAGTASVLGLNSIKQIYPPTTAYLLTDGICTRNCSFCGNSEKLARITWPKIDKKVLLERLKDSNFERICLQTVESIDAKKEVEESLKALVDTGIPVCLSSQYGEEFLALGLDRWTIPIDVVLPDAYRKIKGGDFHKTLKRLKNMVEKYPGKIGTHIIVGLGETEEDVINLIYDLYKSGITLSLFAFTPVENTPLWNHPKPALDSYRRIQIANYLLYKDCSIFAKLSFNNGTLIEAPLQGLESQAFQTFGCDGCNRPFYNESPKGPWYNYPRPLTDNEFEEAVRISLLGK